jgi:D-lactate dehydrogenase (cytochrome)
LSLEYLDENSVEFIREYYPTKVIPEASRGIVYLEVGGDDDGVYEDLEIIDDFLGAYNIVEVQASDDPNWLRMSRELRHSLPESINSYVRRHGLYKIASDIAVPPHRFNDMLEVYREIGGVSKIRYIMYGHIGDYHIHFNFLPTSKDEASRAQNYLLEIMRRGVELGGTLSGEHGVGKKFYIEDGVREPILKIMYGGDALYEMGEMKRAFDPNLILNIGNILSPKYLGK